MDLNYRRKCICTKESEITNQPNIRFPRDNYALSCGMLAMLFKLVHLICKMYCKMEFKTFLNPPKKLVPSLIYFVEIFRMGNLTGKRQNGNVSWAHMRLANHNNWQTYIRVQRGYFSCSEKRQCNSLIFKK